MSPTRATQKSPAAPLYPLLKLLNRQERWAAIRAAAAVPAAERSARTLIGPSPEPTRPCWPTSPPRCAKAPRRRSASSLPPPTARAEDLAHALRSYLPRRKNML